MFQFASVIRYSAARVQCKGPSFRTDCSRDTWIEAERVCCQMNTFAPLAMIFPQFRLRLCNHSNLRARPGLGGLCGQII